MLHRQYDTINHENIQARSLLYMWKKSLFIILKGWKLAEERGVQSSPSQKLSASYLPVAVLDRSF